jgi:hypothetical protein
LLHAVTWQPCSNFKQVVDQYSSYVTSKYGNSSILVSDGYSNGPSITDHEHDRRITSSGSCTQIQIEHHAQVPSNQHGFLSNDSNKSKLIDQLDISLKTKIKDVVRSHADADTIIVSEAIDIAICRRNDIVISDDTDIKIILLYLYNSEMGDICSIVCIKEEKIP